MKGEPIEITANGDTCRVQVPLNIEQFLAQAGWKPSQVVVEYNGKVLPRDQVAAVFLAAGDQLEIIEPVAGG